MNEVAGKEHLEPEIVAAYLDGRLDDEESRRVQSHMYGCASCRTAVVDASGALSTVGKRSRRWIVPTAAAAALAGLVLVGSLLVGLDGDPVVTRGTSPTAASAPTAVETVTPGPDAVVPDADVRFTWRTLRPDAAYAVTVADAGGDPIWRTETRDTSVVLPPDASLEAGARYVWFVDALLPDGASGTSGVQRFEIASAEPER